jgi:hypothetical protein
VDRVEIRLDEVAAGGWSAHGVHLTYAVGTAAQPGPVTLSIHRLVIPGIRGVLENVQLNCPSPGVEASLLRCEGGTGRAILPDLGAKTFRLDASYRRDTERVQLSVQGLALGGGSLGIRGEWERQSWKATLSVTSLATAFLLARLPTAIGRDWSSTGLVSGSATFAGRGNVPNASTGDLRLKDVAFNDDSGLHAGQALSGSLAWQARRDAQGWTVHSDVNISDGQVYVDPVYVDLADAAATASADMTLSSDWRTLRILGFELSQPGTVNARGNALVSLPDMAVERMDVPQLDLGFPRAYETYLKPFLAGTAVGDLDSAGEVSASLSVAGGELRDLRLRPRHLEVTDRQGRFAVRDLEGLVAWSDGLEPSAEGSRLGWAGAAVYGIPVGEGRLDAAFHGSDFVLTRPSRIPMLDGALLLHRLELHQGADGDRSAVLDAELEPLNMSALSRALGWPVFRGKLSGRLPTLTYRNGVARLGGELTASVFGGEVSVDGLSLQDPLGELPEVSARVHLRRLDLEALTDTFDFGRISGSLSGDVDNLRLIGWQPAEFRAWFYTPDNDRRDHRISQRAVKNLASIGGGGAAAVLSQGFLKFFERFSYDRIGLGCVLKEDVCLMKGLAPVDDGYYIVRGSGLPRVDVVGHERAVRWSTLVEQLRSVTTAAPVVK